MITQTAMIVQIMKLISERINPVFLTFALLLPVRSPLPYISTATKTPVTIQANWRIIKFIQIFSGFMVIKYGTW